MIDENSFNQCYAQGTFLDFSFAFLRTNLAHLVQKIWQKNTRHLWSDFQNWHKFFMLKKDASTLAKPLSNQNKIILFIMLEIKPYLE